MKRKSQTNPDLEQDSDLIKVHDETENSEKLTLKVESSENSRVEKKSTLAVDDVKISNDKKEVNPPVKIGKRKKSEEGTKKKKKKAPGKFASAKGIETMFKTAYRVQMDMISLGASKAKIMISINGFLASVLMASGTFIYAAHPLYLVPAVVFLVTAILSLLFAIQAASPGHYNEYVKPQNSSSGKKFSKVKTNFLNYEYYAKLSKKDYVKGMQKTLQDPEKVYLGMIDYLYSIGVIANWNFKMLRYSYLIFRVGIISGMVILLALQTYITLSPKPDKAGSPMVINKFTQFNNIYQPTGIVKLPDGRVLVIEGDQSKSLSLIKLLPNGSVRENSLLDIVFGKTLNISTQGLEAVTMDHKGYIYAITSLSRAGDGCRIPAKQQLIRFKIEHNRITAEKSFDDLGRYLKSIGPNYTLTHPVIEGLTFDPAGKCLLVGFRQPVLDGKAVIMVIDNPHDIFTDNALLKTGGQTVLIDLDGAGIVSLSYDPYLQGYLISSKAKGTGGEIQSQLWYWDGKPGIRPRRVSLPAITDVQDIEGVSPVQVAGKNILMLAIADGNKKSKKPAGYMLLQYNQLIFH